MSLLQRESGEGGSPFGLRKILNQLIAGGITLLVLLVIGSVYVLFHLDRMVEQLELKSYDLRAQVQWGNANRRPSPDVMILQFDDPTLSVLSDEFGVWPWPRDVHARMIHFLNQAGVRALLYDIMFVSYRKGSEKADQMLVDAFHKYPNVYLSMNFDNELAESQKLGKDMSPQDVALLRPLAIHLDSDLNQAPKDTMLKLMRQEDGTVFFNNGHMSFNHYRSIMPSLLAKGSNIGIINHGADDDGVSRGNPLFFQFRYQPFVQTQALPLTAKGDQWSDRQGLRTDADGYLYARTSYWPLHRQSDGGYLDSKPEYAQRVDSQGYVMDSYGHYVYQRQPQIETLYFPYLGLQALLDLKFPGQPKQLKLSRDGQLAFHNYKIPLSANGDFLVNWYNVNVKLEQARNNLSHVERYRQQLVHETEKLEGELSPVGASAPSSPDLSRESKMREQLRQKREEMLRLDSVAQLLRDFLQSDYSPQPYQMVSAWEVIRTMKKQEQGLPLTEEDIALKKLLKNKIIFVGATAVAAYDIKNTSIYSTLPGVVLQANLFDNLYQNDGRFLRRVSPWVNNWVTLFLCLLAAGCTFKMRSALAGLLTTANIAVLYMLLAIVLYQSMSLWINVAMPLLALIVTITITFMLKYFVRNKDYEKTYALATTDSMTNLYNHRFFQEHMRRSIEQANRFKHKFSLILVDIDFFKKFNDTYGHQAGDEVLRNVANKLKKNVRTVDIVARYGGEEMAIILDRANEEEALLVAQKIVKAVAEEAYPIAEGVAKHVTISCGVATYPTHGEGPSQLLDFADAGLYRAKENGRNQVGLQYSDQTSETASVDENPFVYQPASQEGAFVEAWDATRDAAARDDVRNALRAATGEPLPSETEGESGASSPDVA